MKVIITKNSSSKAYEGVTALKLEKGTIEFNYINRFRTSPEDYAALVNKESIILDNSTIVEFLEDQPKGGKRLRSLAF